MIDLKKILSYLPKSKVKELETVTRRIVDTDKAEIIILFGSYARGDYKEERGKDRGKKSDFDILAVVPDYDAEKKLRTELKGKFTDISVPVQVIVEDICNVNSNLRETQYFFTDIKREGKVLYDTGNFKLSKSKELTPIHRRVIAEKDLKMWLGMADANYDNYIHNKENFKKGEARFLGLAAFNLQQVVEMCYTAVEMVFTHYNPYEHNLETLRERTIKFDSRIQDVLPYKTEEQIELFDYLNFAYIGGRYRSEEEFPVTKEQLDYWSREAKKLLDLTETICKERIDCLKEIENKS